MGRKRIRKNGFTLIEVILAMAIFALLMAQVAVTMFVAFKARKAGEVGVEEGRALRYAMNTVGRDIQMSFLANGTYLQPTLGTDATSGWGTDSDTVRLATTADPVRPFTGGADFAEVTLALIDPSEMNLTDTALTTASAGVGKSEFLEKSVDTGDPVLSNPEGGSALLTPPALSSNGEGVLVRRVRRRMMSQTDDVTVDQVICRHVKSFNIRYYDQEQGLWADEFDAQTLGYNPVAMEVTIELAVKDGSPVRKMTRVFNIARSTLGRVTMEDAQ